VKSGSKLFQSDSSGAARQMAIRQFTLNLELIDPDIFYCWNYDPPVKNVGGSLGVILPGGSLHGISYDKLLLLGQGTHTVQFDEADRCRRGLRPGVETADDRLLRQARFELFPERVGAGMFGQPICSLLLALTPGNVQRTSPFLSAAHIEQLQEYAQSIGTTKPERNEQGHSILSSSGSTERIPDENLEAIRKYFGPDSAFEPATG